MYTFNVNSDPNASHSGLAWEIGPMSSAAWDIFKLCFVFFLIL